MRRELFCLNCKQVIAIVNKRTTFVLVNHLKKTNYENHSTNQTIVNQLQLFNR